MPKLPPNRVAAYLAAATSLAGAFAALLGAVDTIEKAIVFVAVVIAVAILAVTFMVGTWRHQPPPTQDVHLHTDAAPTPETLALPVAKKPARTTAANLSRRLDRDR